MLSICPIEKHALHIELRNVHNNIQACHDSLQGDICTVCIINYGYDADLQTFFERCISLIGAFVHHKLKVSSRKLKASEGVEGF